MNIARLTSPLVDTPLQSSPKPRLRLGRQLAILFHPNLTLILCTFFSALSLALLPHLPPLFPNCSSPRESALVYAACLRSHFFVSQPKTLRSRVRGFLSKLHQATCSEESHSCFCFSFFPAEFLAAASNLFLFTATGPDKVAYSMIKHLPHSGMDFLFHIFNFLWSSHSFPSIWKISRWGNLSVLLFPSGLSLLSPSSQSCLNALFYPVYSSLWNLIPFSLLAWPVSALDGLL